MFLTISLHLSINLYNLPLRISGLSISINSLLFNSDDTLLMWLVWCCCVWLFRSALTHYHLKLLILFFYRGLLHKIKCFIHIYTIYLNISFLNFFALLLLSVCFVLELSGKFFFLSTYAFELLFLDINNQHQSLFKYYCVNHMI